MALRQKVMILYLSSSALDSHVVAWAEYDGTGRETHMSGDSDKPPYASGVDALRDGWRLLPMSQLVPHYPGEEFTTSYQKYEFMFEKLEEGVDGP